MAAACAGGVTGLDYDAPLARPGPAGAPVIALMTLVNENTAPGLPEPSAVLDQAIQRAIAGELAGTGLFSKVVSVRPEKRTWPPS